MSKSYTRIVVMCYTSAWQDQAKRQLIPAQIFGTMKPLIRKAWKVSIKCFGFFSYKKNLYNSKHSCSIIHFSSHPYTANSTASVSSYQLLQSFEGTQNASIGFPTFHPCGYMRMMDVALHKECSRWLQSRLTFPEGIYVGSLHGRQSRRGQCNHKQTSHWSKQKMS